MLCSPSSRVNRSITLASSRLLPTPVVPATTSNMIENPFHHSQVPSAFDATSGGGIRPSATSQLKCRSVRKCRPPRIEARFRRQTLAACHLIIVSEKSQVHNDQMASLSASRRRHHESERRQRRFGGIYPYQIPNFLRGFPRGEIVFYNQDLFANVGSRLPLCSYRPREGRSEKCSYAVVCMQQFRVFPMSGQNLVGDQRQTRSFARSAEPRFSRYGMDSGRCLCLYLAPALRLFLCSANYTVRTPCRASLSSIVDQFSSGISSQPSSTELRLPQPASSLPTLPGVFTPIRNTVSESYQSQRCANPIEAGRMTCRNRER